MEIPVTSQRILNICKEQRLNHRYQSQGLVLKSGNLGKLGNHSNVTMNQQSMQRLKMEAQAGDHMTILKSSNLGNRGNPIDFSKNIEHM